MRPTFPRFLTRLASAALVATVVLAAARPTLAQGAVAQAPARPQGQTQSFAVDTMDAKRLREQFVTVLKQYPPSLGNVLRLDPSLFNNEAFLAPYPLLVSFVTQHPEVKRNPSYFLESYSADYYYNRNRSDAAVMWDDLLSGVGFLIIFSMVLSALAWIVRTFMDYRRWNRLSKTQTEVHNKLLDRFTANDELIAYVQSPAGRKFLESAPILLDSGPRAVAAPFGRILWSVQAGLVAASAGLGLWFVSTRMASDFTAGRVTEDVSQPIFTMGIFGLSLGIGFVLSAVVAFVLSRRLGLLDQGKTGSPAPAEPHAG